MSRAPVPSSQTASLLAGAHIFWMLEGVGAEVTVVLLIADHMKGGNQHGTNDAVEG